MQQLKKKKHELAADRVDWAIAVKRHVSSGHQRRTKRLFMANGKAIGRDDLLLCC